MSGNYAVQNQMFHRNITGLFLWLSGKIDDTCSENFPGQAYVHQALPKHCYWENESHTILQICMFLQGPQLVTRIEEKMFLEGKF